MVLAGVWERVRPVEATVAFGLALTVVDGSVGGR